MLVCSLLLMTNKRYFKSHAVIYCYIEKIVHKSHFLYSFHILRWFPIFFWKFLILSFRGHLFLKPCHLSLVTSHWPFALKVQILAYIINRMGSIEAFKCNIFPSTSMYQSHNHNPNYLENRFGLDLGIPQSML